MTTPPANRPQVITIANLVSVARILLVALLWWLLVADQAVWAAWLMILMATTDWLDGWLARRLDQVTQLGAVLDPIGDTLMMASAVVGGMIKTWVPLEVGLLILVRSAVVAGCSAWVAARTRKTIVVRVSGKVAITLLFIAIPAFYFAAGAPDGVRTWMAGLGWTSAVGGLLFYWWSGFMYVRDCLQLGGRSGQDSTAE